MLIYQGCNMLMFLCLSVVPIALGLPLVTMIAVVAVVGAGTALLGVTLDDVGKEGDCLATHMASLPVLHLCIHLFIHLYIHPFIHPHQHSLNHSLVHTTTTHSVGFASGDLTWSEVVRSAQAIPDHFKEDARAGLLLPFQVLFKCLKPFHRCF